MRGFHLLVAKATFVVKVRLLSLFEFIRLTIFPILTSTARNEAITSSILS